MPKAKPQPKPKADPKPKQHKKVMRGGPFAKVEVAVRELPDGSLPTQLPPLEFPDGRYAGRYVLRKIEQKSRTLQVYEWETRQHQLAVIHEALRRNCSVHDITL